MAFKSTDLSAEQPLGDDPLLGFGRNAQDPYRGLITDEGAAVIPLDLRGTGFWLTGLFGDPTVSETNAAASIVFSAQPADGATITLNGVTWTLVSGTPGANETQIGGDLDATLTALASDLNGSADAEIARCTYAADTDAAALTITHDTAGTVGNSFTVAASASANGTPSSPTLVGGGYRHEWLSGSDEIPSFTFEVGHPKLVTPVFFRHLGTVMESLAFEMGQEGPANGTVQLVAQGEEKTAATVDAAPVAFALKRFSQGRGFIRRDGVALAQVTGGNLTFSNNLERVRVIRDDGKIAGADPDHRDVHRRHDHALRRLEPRGRGGQWRAGGAGVWLHDDRRLAALLRAVPGVPAEAQVRHRRARRRRGQLRLARRLR